jgi:hypothetical protein
MMTRSRKPVGEQSTARPHERFEMALVRGITLLAAWSRGERARRHSGYTSVGRFGCKASASLAALRHTGPGHGSERNPPQPSDLDPLSGL